MSADRANAMVGVRHHCLRGGLLLGTLLFLGAGLVLPQPAAVDPGKDKSILPADPKADPPKAVVPGKDKSAPPAEPKGDAAKGTVPGKDKAVLPAELKVEPAKTAAPGKDKGVKSAGTITLSEERYQELLALERKLKSEREVPRSCQLTGELTDGTVVFEAAFVIRTEAPNMFVPLGLQEGFLFDPKGHDQEELAKQDLALKVEDDGGFVLEVPRRGDYKIVLHLKVPVQRRTGEGSGGERGIKLGLAGAAVTELALAMPDSIKEVRWNAARKEDKDREDRFRVERIRQDGRWQILLGTRKTLDLVWKEPIVLPGSGPLLVVKNEVSVKLEETISWMVADMQVEDLRGQAREYQLLLPSHPTEVKVKGPPGVAHELQSPPPDSKNQMHIIRFNEPVSSFSVHVEVRNSRKGSASLAVGPFFVLNAYSQQGTITVQASPAALRGQWLNFQPADGTRRRDVSKGPAGQDVKAIFDWWNVPGPMTKPGKETKIPLLIDWRGERTSVETFVDHQLKLRQRPGGRGLQIDLTTQIKIRSASTQDYLDLQLPRPPLPKLGLLCGMPAAPFPGSIPWGGFFQNPAEEAALAEPIGNFILEEDPGLSPALLSAPDAAGKAQIKNIPPNRELTLTLSGKYYVAAETPNGSAETHHFRIELPRPVGTVDRGGKAPTVSVDEQMELLVGPPKLWDSSYPFLDLSWRPYHPQFLVHNLAEIWLRGKEAHIRQELKFNWSPTPGKEMPKTGIVSLRLPRNLRGSVKFSGGDLVSQLDDVARVKLTGTEPLVVDFHQPLPDNADWKVPLVAPESATGLEAKVRIWSEPGVLPEAVEVGERWQDRGPELVVGQDLPALVLHGAGKTLDLTLRFSSARASKLPAMVCDKGLIQVRVEADGDHFYRAHYLIQKLYANPLDVELPAPADSCMLRITLNDREVHWTRDRDERNVAHLSLDPKILRQLAQAKGTDDLLLVIEYKLPANFAEYDTRWQTLLCGPIFRGEVFLGRVRWLVSLPNNWVAVPAASNILPDFRWSLQGWLLAPEATLNPAELDAWSAKQDDALALVFSRRSQEAIPVIHFPRQTWLLLCSGLLLTIGLALHMLPLPRSVFWVILAGLCLGLIVGGFVWPAWVPSLLFGIQPGAVVLGMILTVHWVLNERYRRQVIFMPGFTRMKPGSSLRHSAPIPRQQRDPSTVDAPAPSVVQGNGNNQEPSS